MPDPPMPFWHRVLSLKSRLLAWGGLFSLKTGAFYCDRGGGLVRPLVACFAVRPPFRNRNFRDRRHRGRMSS